MKIVGNLKIIFIYMFASFLALICIYPLIFSLISSVKCTDEIFYTMFSLPTVYHFEYYLTSLKTANMAIGLMNSLIITSVATALLIIIASTASFAIARIDFKFNNAVLIFFIIGIMTPIHSTLIPLVKIVNSVNGRNNYITMILLYTAFQLPLSIFLAVGYMKGLDKEIEESAIIDGCGYCRLLLKIAVPLSAPIISTVGIIAFLFIYNELIFAVLFLTKRSMFTVSLCMLSFFGERSNDYGPIFASIILSIVPMIIIYLLLQEKVEKGLSAGAVKG